MNNFLNGTIDLKYLLHAFDKNVIFSATDLKGCIVYVSDAFCKISKYKSQELINKNHNIVRHPDMPSKVFKDMWDNLLGGKRWSGEIKNRAKDGSEYWVLAKIEPYFDSDGKKIGYHAVREDITAQKKVEQLKENLENINDHLEKQIEERIVEVVSLNRDIKETQKEIIFTMGAIGESRCKETGNHVTRVAEYSRILAEYSGMDKFNAEMLKEASPMHDIGKIGIADSILNKPAKLTSQEREIMNTHVTLGYEMLRHTDKKLLKIAATVAHEHHEKWDGSGYPRGLKGEDISIYGRITAIADVFDALGSNRAYKKAWKNKDIFQMFKDEKGKHFDPTLVDIFLNNIDDFLAVRDKFYDY
ncbi:MAG: HD domain-containing protein [Sulfurimonas sp.]|nr:HD domain-containing protein [Sulfurimonas sp.]